MKPPQEHEDAIYIGAMAAVGAAVPGAFIPLSDMPIIATIWTTMVIAIADKSGRSADQHTAMKLCMATIRGGGAYVIGSKVFTFILNAIPGIGSFGAAGINSVLNFIYTIRFGSSVAYMMDRPNFDINDVPVGQLLNGLFALPSIDDIRDAWDYIQRHK